MSIDSSLCFRRFRKKHTELSRLYWWYVLSQDAALKILAGGAPTDYAVDIIGASFKRGMLSVTAQEFTDTAEQMLSRSRLHLLVVCSANVEAYLKEITFAFLASKGHTKSYLKLDAIGEALGSPILDRASLPDPLEYAEKLFDVTLGKARSDWNHFYKLRCALAHNGGVVSARTLREVPSLKLPLNSLIGLSWTELFSALEAADKIVETIDNKLRSKELKRSEIAKELAYLKEAKQLPQKNDVWKFLHEQFGLTQTKQPFKSFVYSEFYGKSS
jgi:hypothetical protein